MKSKKPVLIRFREGKLHRFHCKHCKATYLYDKLLLCPKCNGEMGIIIRTRKGTYKLIPLIYPTITPPEATTLRKIIRP